MKLLASDIKLLGLLQRNSGRTTVELAEAAGVSQSVCWRRLQALREAGVISSQVSLLDRKKLGLQTLIFAQVKLSAHGRAHLADFSKSVRAFPEIMECHVILGDFDFLLKIVTASVEAYEHFFFEKLSSLRSVQEVHSLVALSEIKSTTELPLASRPKDQVA